MNKKLTAKIQKLVPMLGEKEAVFSSSIAIEPPERDLLLKKGNVYTVFDIASSTPLSIGLLTNIINDVLFESYYHSDNVSPIQSLEKSIVNINEKLNILGKESANAEAQEGEATSEISLEFNIIAAVLWGNVLYIVQYGKGKSFLMREGDIKEVSATSEGKFSVASGVVNSDDVIVLSTENFSGKFPPDKLLSTALSSNDLEPDQSSMVLKFMIDAEFTDNEMVDFNLPNEKKSSKISMTIENIKSRKLKKESKVKPIETLADMSTINDPSPAQQQEPVSIPAQSQMPQQTEPVIQNATESPNIKIRSKLNAGTKSSAKIIMLTVAALLVISIFVTIIIKNNQNNGETESKSGGSSLTVPTELNRSDTAEPTEPVEEDINEIDTEKQRAEDIKNNVARIAATPFYDIKLVNESSDPKGLVVFSDTIAVTDTTTGNIYTSDVSTPKFTAKETAYTGLTNAQNYDGRLNFTDNEGFKVVEVKGNEQIEAYTGDFGVVGVYLGNIYSIKDGVLTKYVKESGELTDSVWAENSALNNVTAMDIAYSIYTVTSNGDLNVFTSGQKANFSVTGLDTKLSRPTDIEADVNFDYIYVADSGNNRVVVLDDKGALIKQIKTEDETAWSDIRAIGVTSDETTLYVLSGSKVYDVNLVEALKPIEVENTEDSLEEPASEETTPQEQN